MENNNEFDVKRINEALKREHLDVTIENLKANRDGIERKIWGCKIVTLGMGALALINLACGSHDLLNSLAIGLCSFTSGMYFVDVFDYDKELQSIEKEIDELEETDFTFQEGDNSMSLGVGKTLHKTYAKRRNIGK